jgi:uncharacterized protein YdeI (YjbR/CyaY-like superfamily)
LRACPGIEGERAERGKYHIVVDQTYEQFYAPDRAAWRAWLQEHHLTAPGVWLIYYKKRSGKPRVAYADAVEEPLCHERTLLQR